MVKRQSLSTEGNHEALSAIHFSHMCAPTKEPAADQSACKIIFEKPGQKSRLQILQKPGSLAHAQAQGSSSTNCESEFKYAGSANLQCTAKRLPWTKYP